MPIEKALTRWRSDDRIRFPYGSSVFVQSHVVDLKPYATVMCSFNHKSEITL